MAVRMILILALAVGTVNAAQVRLGNAANPIRKVVTMLQQMQKKVQAEGEKQTQLFDKYMCYCKNSGGDLGKSIADATAKVPAVTSDIEEGEAKKAQLDEDLKAHKADRAEAKAAIDEAASLRQKEGAAFAAEKNEADSNIGAMNKAVAALEAGMAGGFLQTGAAQLLRKFVANSQDVSDSDREEIQSFLSQGAEYNPASGQITGILKTMVDEMAKGLAEATAAEEAAIKSYNELVAAKKKGIAALTKMIEEKLTRSGALAVEIALMKNDLTDTQEALVEDKKFLADLQTNCETKQKEWDEVVKQRGLELVALAETIKVLNDDDALELFKKTLPSASASFVQVEESATAIRARALAAVRAAQKFDAPGRLDFIALALHGKKIGFEKVLKMIDEMVTSLKTEQKDDDNKKEYCSVQFDQADDKKKALERSVSDLEAQIAEAQEGIATMTEEIKALQDGIKALDRSVKEATEQRKDEHQDFQNLMASDSAAKEVLKFAKNRLNKFYNPKLYKAPAKRELTEEQRITVANGGTLAPTAAPGGIAGTGITVLAQKDAPPPAPEAPGAFKKSESGGVIGMIDLLVKDLDKEMTVAETTEEDGQKDYETTMKDSAEKRAADAKHLSEKEGAKAELASSLEAATEEKASTSNELGATLQTINSLHNECDWLIQYFDVRKEARAGEIDALGKAKAVLSGATFSLLQTKAAFLGRA